MNWARWKDMSGEATRLLEHIAKFGTIRKFRPSLGCKGYTGFIADRLAGMGYTESLGNDYRITEMGLDYLTENSYEKVPFVLGKMEREEDLEIIDELESAYGNVSTGRGQMGFRGIDLEDLSDEEVERVGFLLDRLGEDFHREVSERLREIQGNQRELETELENAQRGYILKRLPKKLRRFEQ